MKITVQIQRLENDAGTFYEAEIKCIECRIGAACEWMGRGVDTTAGDAVEEAIRVARITNPRFKQFFEVV